jgi:hypothetical protein
MGAVNLPANRGGPPNWQGSTDRGTVAQLQAHTRHSQPAPQVETAAAVACW